MSGQELTDEEITTIYDRLSQMQVRLDADPRLGSIYLFQKIQEARHLQDEVTDLVVKINAGLSVARQQARAMKAIAMITKTPEDMAQARAREDLADRLSLLKQAAQVRRHNLTRVSSDSRLLLDCIKVSLMGGGGPDHALAATSQQTLRVAPSLPDVDVAIAGSLDQLFDGPRKPVEIIDAKTGTLEEAGSFDMDALFVEEDDPPF